ncbi:MAG TPA: type II toxin-antitoxin system RelE/ParE family toxin [Rhodanobacter sp.]|nr:type II toxin-antitoxin system RelE/ParE family toxin [Rhodanobacter sp.]
MNRIDWTPRAAKQLRKLPRPAQVDIRDAVQDKLPHFPSCSGVKALVNHTHGYRLRVGNYRVLFDFEGSIKLVRIEEVGKRDERTY